MTLIVPIAVGLVWGGSALANRLSNLFLGESTTSSKTNQVAKETLAPIPDAFFSDAISIIKSMVENQAPEQCSQTLFDSKSIPAATLQFMKTTTLSEIEFKDTDGATKFKVAKKANNEEFIEFSNRSATNGELRADLLRDKIESKRNEESGKDVTLYDAIKEFLGSILESDTYSMFEGLCKTSYPMIEKPKLDAFTLQLFELLKEGESVDVQKAKEIFQNTTIPPLN